LSPRKALALLPMSGAEVPRGLKSAVLTLAEDGDDIVRRDDAG
jgi:hypothetical protein